MKLNKKVSNKSIINLKHRSKNYKNMTIQVYKTIKDQMPNLKRRIHHNRYYKPIKDRSNIKISNVRLLRNINDDR